jgi:DNA-binding protein HU-alpha
MNKKELVEVISKKHDTTKKDAAAIVETIIESVSKELKKGKDVELYGFGKFKINTRKAGTRYNPFLKKSVKMPSQKYVKFVPTKSLKDSVK